MNEKMFESMAERLKEDIAKEIAYVYAVFVPDDSEKVISIMKRNIPLKDRAFLDQDLQNFAGGNLVFPYDVLNSSIEKHIAEFYDELGLSLETSKKLDTYGNRGKEFERQFNERLNQSKDSAISTVKHEMNLQMMQNKDAKSAIAHIRKVLTRRLASLESFLKDSAGQLKQYMLLWDYEDKGYTHYRIKTNGDNCEECTKLDGKVFLIGDAEMGESLMPFHPNCDCFVEVLDKNQNAAIAASQNTEDEDGANPLGYLRTSLKQIFWGNYAEDVNLGGVLGQVGLGFLGVDVLADIRDLIYDVTHFEVSAGHIVQTLFDVLSILPVIGALKYTDEAGDVLKGAIKHGDDAAEAVKAAKKVTDFSDYPKQIHLGKQGKHIVGHNNYIKGKSLLDISISEAQSLVNKYSGKGQKIGKNKERVDFGKVIGRYVDPKTGKLYNTTVGTIHYSNSGTHIVPEKPIDWRN